MPLLVDDRERDLVRALPEACRADVRRLVLGDVLFTDAAGAVVLALERKTVADLRASVLDGRLADQRERLREVHGGRVAFVVEGSVDHGDPRLAGVLTGLLLRHRVPVFRTADVADTAALVAHLMASADRGRLEAYGTPPAAAASAGGAKKKVTGRDAAEAMLACVSGVSAAAARVVLDRFGSVHALARALEADGPRAVSELAVNGRRLGKVGDKLRDALVSAPGAGIKACCPLT